MSVVDNKFSTIPDFLGNNNVFIIPPNQRGYSWQEAQVKAVFSDLQLALSNKNHYFGPIVLNDKAANEAGFGGGYTYEVADGQQRLTTFYILLDRLYKYIDDELNNLFIYLLINYLFYILLFFIII